MAIPTAGAIQEDQTPVKWNHSQHSGAGPAPMALIPEKAHHPQVLALAPEPHSSPPQEQGHWLQQGGESRKGSRDPGGGTQV